MMATSLVFYTSTQSICLTNKGGFTMEVILKEDIKEAMNKLNGFKAKTIIGWGWCDLMRLKGLIKPLENSDKFKEIIKDINSNRHPVNI